MSEGVQGRWTLPVCPSCGRAGRDGPCCVGDTDRRGVVTYNMREPVPVVPCDEAAVERATTAVDDLMCPECDGEGKVSKFLEPETLSGIAEVDCELCGGSGEPYPRLVVVAVLRAAASE